MLQQADPPAVLSNEGNSRLRAGSTPIVSSGHWFIFAVWVIASLAGAVAALQPDATRGWVVVVVAAVTLAIAGGSWAIGRLSRYSLTPLTRPRRSTYVGTAIPFFALWWIVNAIIQAPGLYQTAPGTAANFIWFTAGLQLTELLARAVDRFRRPEVVGLNGSPQKP